MSTLDDLVETIEEAERYIKKAKIARDRLLHLKNTNAYGYYHPELAAAKRSSMDLSKSLVKIRRTFRS